VRFRQWATRVLRENLTSGYTLHQTRLAEKGLDEPRNKELMIRLIVNLLVASEPTS
jgi:hypothetical protein